MIVIAGMLLGALFGANLARKRRGSRLDIAHYAAAFGIGFALLGLLVTLLIDRSLNG